jgi:CDP-glucose 4,6-dehydratase
MEMKRKVSLEFWRNKKVFLTGHTGFKGSWISLWLHELGAIVKGYSLEPPTNPSLYEIAQIKELIVSEIGDIRDFASLKKCMVEFNPDILIHLAAQPLVRLSYASPLDTYETNVMGTANVLEAARSCNSLKAIVSVTTDKCYENKEWVWPYREDEAMGGYDPYSSSKGCAELVSSAYRRSFFNNSSSAALATARAGNVIGGGDWAMDRLIPDVLNAFQNNIDVIIRSPNAIRPWQHVLEPLSGYLLLAEDLYNNGQCFAEAWNFGPEEMDCKPVSWILEKLIELWGNGASWKLDQTPNLHEAMFLKLDCSKAKYRIGWVPKWHIEEALSRIVSWQKSYLQEQNMRELTLKEIREYNS